MTKKILICLAVIAAVASGFLYGKGLLYVHDKPALPNPPAPLVVQKTLKTAPPVAFNDGAGQRQALSGFRGKYVLVNLWATWCAPCVLELPALAKLEAAVPALKVAVVNVDRSKVDAAAFLKSHDAASLTPYVDSNTVMMRSFRAIGLPLTVLIDPQGKIIARAEGPAEWNSPEAVAYFKALTGS
jgi:thiol-disulfide isomerase/thioredoxin